MLVIKTAKGKNASTISLTYIISVSRKKITRISYHGRHTLAKGEGSVE
jgi:hypothetical protein